MKHNFDASYFETMAQVIPVFWLVLLVERRFGSNSPSQRELVTAATANVLAAFGEIICIFQMQRQHPSSAAGLLVQWLAFVVVLMTMMAFISDLPLNNTVANVVTVLLLVLGALSVFVMI